MKKLVVTMLTLLTCGAAYALPIGNPSEASLFLNGVWCDSYCCDPCDPCFSWCDAWSIRIGFYGDYVFNRHLEICNHEHNCGADIDDTEIYTSAGYLAFNICDRVDVFATLGATDIHIKTDASAWTAIISEQSEIAFETRFSWSVGARATLWECDCFAVGVEGQYFQTNPDIDYFLRYSDGSFTYFNDNNETRYSEWQVGLGIAYRFATSCPTIAMVPYAGVKWAWSRFDLDDFTFTLGTGTGERTFTFRDLEAKKLWGYAVGMSLTLCDMIGVTVEGRWADEKAVYVNGQFRF